MLLVHSILAARPFFEERVKDHANGATRLDGLYFSLWRDNQQVTPS